MVDGRGDGVGEMELFPFGYVLEDAGCLRAPRRSGQLRRNRTPPIAARQRTHQGRADLEVVPPGREGVVGRVEAHHRADLGGGGAAKLGDLGHPRFRDEALGVLHLAQQGHQR